MKRNDTINKRRKKSSSYSKKMLYMQKKNFSTDDKNKKYHKLKDHCHYTGKYRGAAHNICNLRYKVPKEIPVVFHNGSKYDFHFIVKELAEEFEGTFECLGENTEKYITFSVPIKKEITKQYQDGNDKITKIPPKIKFIDSFRFMSSSLSSLLDNLSEGLHSDKCTDCKSCLDYMTTKDEQLIFKCSECKNNYPYEYMDSWEKFDETSLPEKEDFYSSLNMEDITDVDQSYAKRVFENLSNKNLGDYHDFYVQSDKFLKLLKILETCVLKYMN